MRKMMLGSVTTLSVGVLAGTAYAQTPEVPPPPVLTQGQVAMTPAKLPPASANDNNNSQASAFSGAVGVPTPGTLVVHINGRVEVDFMGIWSSADQRFATAPAGSPGGPTIAPGAATPAATVLGNNGTGTVKLAPQNISSYMRLYAGADGMATNGLRYGAAIEIRQNFSGQISNSGSSGASGYSSLETLFVRRAFTYVAGANWGILRAGQADGLIGIFDNGVTTFQFLPTGNLSGSDLQNFPSNAIVPFWFLSLSGNEYGNAKLVYLSPQIAGFDFGIQYAPNMANGFGEGGNNTNGLTNSIIGSGTGTGLGCTVANSGCPSLSSGPGIQDGSRVTNQTAIGVRYQDAFGNLGVLAYGMYEFSGVANYTGLTTPAVLGTTSVPGSRFNGKYRGLNFGNGGIALTYAGVTLGGNIIGGALNGALAAQPQGGAPEIAYMLGAKYTYGPWVAGIAAEIGWYQGTVTMSGLSQRLGRGIDAGVGFSVAPGFTVYAEYLWNDMYQGGVNQITGAVGSGANNEIKGKGFLIGNNLTF
jgi:hypothetical protein